MQDPVIFTCPLMKASFQRSREKNNPQLSIPGLLALLVIPVGCALQALE
jgi:hypothetical protein